MMMYHILILYILFCENRFNQLLEAIAYLLLLLAYQAIQLAYDNL